MRRPRDPAHGRRDRDRGVNVTTPAAAPQRDSRALWRIFPGKPLVRGSIAVGGGVLAHLILGSMYCWGNFLSYMPKKLLFFDGARARA